MAGWENKMKTGGRGIKIKSSLATEPLGFPGNDQCANQVLTLYS